MEHWRGPFFLLAEHIIESFYFHYSKVFHVKALPGRLVGEMSGHNVVIDTKIRGMQQLVKICRLRSHGWLLVRFDSICSSVENESKDEIEFTCSEVICLSCVILKLKMKDGRKISHHTSSPASSDHFWLPDNSNGIFVFIFYMSVYMLQATVAPFYRFVNIHGDAYPCFLHTHGD